MAIRLHFRFPKQTTVSVAKAPPFPDRASFDAHHEGLVEAVLAALEQAGVESCAREQDTYRTGGHADIGYYAVRLADAHGGAELVLYQVDQGGEYEPLTPWVRLFRDWTAHRAVLQRLAQSRTS
jgi:hypothetical protein